MVEEEMNCNKEDSSLRTVAARSKDRAFEGEKMSLSKVGAPTTFLEDDAPTLSTTNTTATVTANTTTAVVLGRSKVNNNTLADGIPTLSAATSDTTESNTTATNNNDLQSSSSTDMLPDEVKNVLSLSFPRCSVCDTDWYNYKEGEEEDTKMPAKTTESRKRKRNTSTTTRQRPSHYTLYPMPKCQCSTRLAVPHNINLQLPPASRMHEDTNNNTNKESPTNILSKIATHTFSNLAMCKCCLQKSLQTSNEVITHDYRQSHIKDGQPDVKFTVDTKCTICKQKFLPRQLMRFLSEQERGEKKSGVTKKKGKTDINWYDAVEATIKLVGWGKKHQRRERKQSRKKRAKMTNVNDNDDDEKRDTWWIDHDGFTGGGGNYSSDDCYSYSSDDDDSDDDDDDINYCSHKRSSNVHRISTKKGELLNELLSKDPKLKQELEDVPYAKQLQDEEEKRRLAVEAQEKKDREFAEKMQKEMQQEIDEQEKKRKTEKKEPAKTKGARRKSSPIDNPIFNAWSASAKKKKKAMKKSPLKQQQLDECLLQQNSSAKKQQSMNSIAESTEVQHEETVPSSSAAASTSTTNQLEDSVQTIVAMGFNNEEAARQCLNDADGNVQRAITMLLSGASVGNK